MDSDEIEIFKYLGSCAGQFVSAIEISRRASSRSRFQADPRWAAAALRRLVDGGKIEADGKERYRLQSAAESPKPRRWISPEIQKILEDSGKQFDAIDPASPEGPAQK